MKKDNTAVWAFTWVRPQIWGTTIRNNITRLNTVPHGTAYKLVGKTANSHCEG